MQTINTIVTPLKDSKGPNGFVITCNSASIVIVVTANTLAFVKLLKKWCQPVGQLVSMNKQNIINHKGMKNHNRLVTWQ